METSVSWSLLCLFFLNLSLSSLEASPVNIGLILPQHTFLRRAWSSSARRAIMGAQRDLDNDAVQLKSYIEFVKGLNEAEDSRTAFCGLVDEDKVNTVVVAGEDGTEPAAEQAAHLARQLQVPALIWNSAGYTPVAASDAPVLYLMPTLRQQGAAMLQFMSLYGWTNYVIVSEYPAAIFDGLTASGVVEIGQKSASEVLTELHSQLSNIPHSTKVILLFATRSTSEDILAEASRSPLADANHLWLMSSAVVGELDRPVPREYPVGSFAFYYNYGDTKDGVIEAIEKGVATWYSAVKEVVMSGSGFHDDEIAASCVDGIPLSNGKKLFNLMQDRANGAFDSQGSPSFASLEVLNLKQDSQWKKVGDWSAEEGLDMDTLVWPGGEQTQPAPHT